MRRTHKRDVEQEAFVARIAPLLEVAPNNGCWIRLGEVNKGGYASLVYKKKRHQAHRIIYEGTVGPIPAGMLPYRTCENLLCRNLSTRTYA